MSTEFTKQIFQWFFDIQTVKDKMTIVSVSAGGENLRARLGGFFGMFRYFKLGSIGIKLIPASTLPVDPTGLSLEAGESTVDPRDQLNPGMVRITNGESIVQDLDGTTPAKQRAIYNNMLLDPRWFKFMLQKGVSRHAYPLYWNVGQLAQDIYPGTFTNYPVSVAGTWGKTANDTIAYHEYASGNALATQKVASYSDPRGLFQTGREKLGWIPTTIFEPGLVTSEDPNYVAFTPIPEVEVMNIVLPPAYKTIYYYRCFVTEEVSFREVAVNSPGINTGQGEISAGSIDNFQYVTPSLSSSGISKVEVGNITTPNDGGSRNE